MPKVSVVLTSYNHETFISQAIQSVIDQSFEDFELIIWDDASTDSSWEIIQSYSDPRIRSFRRNKTNRAMINEALEKAVTGEYVAIHHSDDVWLPSKLQSQVEILDSNPSFGAVFSHASPINEKGQALKDRSNFYYESFYQDNKSRPEWLRQFLEEGNTLCHPSALVRKSCYEKLGPYKYGLAQSADMEFWIRLLCHHDIHIVQEVLVYFRVRDYGANESGNRPVVHVRWANELMQTIKSFKGLSSSELFKVFPELKSKVKGDNPHPHFALARICLEKERPLPIQFFGLNLLFDLINNSETRKKLEQEENFDYSALVNLTGEIDTFRTLGTLNFSELRVQNIPPQRQLVSRQGISTFRGSLPAGTSSVRFSPLNHAVVLSNPEFKLAGSAIAPTRSNEWKKIDNTHYFITRESEFVFEFEPRPKKEIFEARLRYESTREGVLERALAHREVVPLRDQPMAEILPRGSFRLNVMRLIYRLGTGDINFKAIVKNYFSKAASSLAGPGTHCPLCTSSEGFSPLPDFYRDNARKNGFPYFGQGEMTNIEQYFCTSCQASDRERLYAHWILDLINRGELGPKSKVLHCAPEPTLSSFLKNCCFESYETADLFMDDVDHQVDLEQLPFDDDSYDFIICSHVLEHVTNDQQALNEMYRVLRAKGKALLMVPIPIGLETTDEDPSITDTSERWRRFGQDDHVRLYARKDFIARIERAGFTLEELEKSDFPKGLFKQLGLKDSSRLYVGKK